MIAARRETRGIWLKNGAETRMLAEGFMPRRLKQSHAMVGLLGFGCVTHPMFLRAGDLGAGKLGIFEVDHPLSALEVADEGSASVAASLLGPWWLSRNKLEGKKQ